MILLVREVEPTPPRTVDPAIPRDLETICLKAMRKEPESRYASARLLADDLRRFRDGKAISARRVSFGERVFRVARRHPVAAGLLLIVAMLSLFVLGGSIQYFRVVKENERRRQRS